MRGTKSLLLDLMAFDGVARTCSKRSDVGGKKSEVRSQTWEVVIKQEIGSLCLQSKN